MVYNCTTICKFMVKFAGMSITELLRGIELITGEELTGEELFRYGERSLNLQRLLNIRDGMSRKDDTVPPKMLQPAAVGGRAFKAPTREEFDRMLDDYYKIRGWDENGIPKVETLEKLGLGEYVRFLP